MSKAESCRVLLIEEIDRWSMVGHPALAQRFVLRNGMECKPQRLPAKYKQGQAKQCYMNATLLAARHKELRYVEGYAFSMFMLFQHAWVIDKDDNVIDTTWPWRTHSDALYFGVPFDLDFLKKETLKNGYYGLFENGWRINHALMFRLDPELEKVTEKIKPFRRAA